MALYSYDQPLELRLGWCFGGWIDGVVQPSRRVPRRDHKAGVDTCPDPCGKQREASQAHDQLTLARKACGAYTCIWTCERTCGVQKGLGTLLAEGLRHDAALL